MVAPEAMRVAVIVAHPDDAEICAGGTIALLAGGGCEVTVVNFTTSEYTPEATRLRREAAEKAATILGHELRWILDGSLRQVEEVPEFEVVRMVDDLLVDLRPDVVISHSVRDSHVDHARLARAALAATRRWRGDLYALPPSEHRISAAFEANVLVDITDYEERKREAIECFRFEGGFRKLDVDAILAAGRVAGAAAGCGSAERFQAVRVLGLPVATLGDSELR